MDAIGALGAGSLGRYLLDKVPHPYKCLVFAALYCLPLLTMFNIGVIWAYEATGDTDALAGILLLDVAAVVGMGLCVYLEWSVHRRNLRRKAKEEAVKSGTATCGRDPLPERRADQTGC